MAQSDNPEQRLGLLGPNRMTFPELIWKWQLTGYWYWMVRNRGKS